MYTDTCECTVSMINTISQQITGNDVDVEGEITFH